MTAVTNGLLLVVIYALAAIFHRMGGQERRARSMYVIGGIVLGFVAGIVAAGELFGSAP
ncbi:MAG: hypothetical protein AB7R90_22070 [Reyranellaceae bacterium]